VWLQVVEDHVIRKTADVQFGVMMTVRIAATDEQPASTVTSHVGQWHGLVVEQQGWQISVGLLPPARLVAGRAREVAVGLEVGN
jgi:hypothetical protein